MSNNYYTPPTDIAALTRARSGDINLRDDAVDAAFDKVPDEAKLKRGTVNYAVTGGAADAYTVTLPYVPSGYVDGLLVNAYIHATNTGASTVNVNSLGVKSIKLQGGGNPLAGDLQKFVDLRYSTTTGFFHVQGNTAGSVSDAAASAAAAAASASAASSSAASAAASYDSFDDRYLGPKTSDPTLDNDGNALLTGALYFNTTSNTMRIYTGSAWLPSTASSANVTFSPAGTGSVPTTVENKLRESVSVKDFGAVGDFTTDDTAAINAAINYINSLPGGGIVVVPNGVFGIGAYSYSGISAGVAGIVLKSNVTLQIEGTIKAKNGIYGAGALYGIIRTLDAGISNAHITGKGIVDGNRSNQVASTQCNNIYLCCLFNVTVQGIYSVSPNGMGIQLIPPYVAGGTHTACSVNDCFVNDSTNIGIQVSHGLNTTISDNRITTCVNNCIDIYGEVGTVTPDNGITTITGNVVAGGLVGIFPETSSRVVVSGNAINGCTTGVQTNRVNGQPTDIVISSNVITNTPTGVSLTGDSKGILVANNVISSFSTAGIALGDVSGNVSYVTITGNVFNPSATTTNVIAVAGGVVSFCTVKDNFLLDAAHNAANLITQTGTVTNCVLEPLQIVGQNQPVKKMANGATTSGGTVTYTLPAAAAGKIIFKSGAGGAWDSVWTGVFVSSGTIAQIAQTNSTFVSPGNNVTGVTVTGASLVVTFAIAASGSAGFYQLWIEYLP